MPSIADLMSAQARERLTARLRELEEIDRLVRERGSQQPPDPPPTLAAISTAGKEPR